MYECPKCQKSCKNKDKYEGHMYHKHNKYKYIDLFAGTGAFSHSFGRDQRYECVYSNDIDFGSKCIYQLNHPEHRFTNNDINDVDVKTIPSHNIMCCGFSCQPFSIAGKREGFNDSRSNVFYKILDIMKYHKPAIVILENVKNLKTHDHGCTYKYIRNKIRELGYDMKVSILDTCKMTSIPQHRERIYILCFKYTEDYEAFDFQFETHKLKSISSLLETDIDDKYYYTDKYIVYDKVQDGVKKHINTDTVYQYRRQYVRENKSSVCPTLTANMGGGGHNVPLIKDDNGIRKLTPRECFNLQGFSKDYKLPPISDSKLYKLAGNAVSVPVINQLIDKITKIL